MLATEIRKLSKHWSDLYERLTVSFPAWTIAKTTQSYRRRRPPSPAVVFPPDFLDL